MRNTTHKLFKDKTLRHLHDECNICGVVKNHFLALCMRYYRRYGKTFVCENVEASDETHFRTFVCENVEASDETQET